MAVPANTGGEKASLMSGLGLTSNRILWLGSGPIPGYEFDHLLQMAFTW